MIDMELQNLKSASTWEVVEGPEGVNVVDSKWVFRLKKNEKGEIIKWKARLVAVRLQTIKREYHQSLIKSSEGSMSRECSRVFRGIEVSSSSLDNRSNKE